MIYAILAAVGGAIGLVGVICYLAYRSGQTNALLRVEKEAYETAKRIDKSTTDSDRRIDDAMYNRIRTVRSELRKDVQNRSVTAARLLDTPGYRR